MWVKIKYLDNPIQAITYAMLKEFDTMNKFNEFLQKKNHVIDFEILKSEENCKKKIFYSEDEILELYKNYELHTTRGEDFRADCNFEKLSFLDWFEIHKKNIK